MDREIKFRAKCCYSSDWVYGNLIHSEKFAGCPNEWRIHNPEYGLESDVIPETVGQYIGLRDKNGNDIYEGDIVEAYSQGSKATFQIKWREGPHPGWILYPAWKNREIWSISPHKNTDGLYCDDLKIIGNIHDNPELILNN